MKRIILGISLAGLFMSCHKVQEGDNKGVIKMNEGAEGAEGFTYDAGAQGKREHYSGGENGVASSHAMTSDSLKSQNVHELNVKADSVKTSGNEVTH